MVEDDKIKIIVADDNRSFCEIIVDYLKKYEFIEVLGVANNDEEEITMIERLKPEIVITDLVRNRRYTGLKIIKDYQNKKVRPKFLIISADEKEYVKMQGIEIDEYVEKPCLDYSIIVEKIKKLKSIKEENRGK